MKIIINYLRLRRKLDAMKTHHYNRYSGKFSAYVSTWKNKKGDNIMVGYSNKSKNEFARSFVLELNKSKSASVLAVGSEKDILDYKFLGYLVISPKWTNPTWVTFNNNWELIKRDYKGMDRKLIKQTLQVNPDYFFEGSEVK